VRIAITGAAGYIGGWLRTVLYSRRHLVFGQDRVSVPRHHCVVFDLADHGMRRDWLAEARPDAVIHLAALYGRVWGETNLISTAAANAGVTAELARDCDRAGVPLMYVSSSEVYGRAATAGTVTEESALDPLNMYGLSKKWGEEACRVYAPAGLVVARLNMPYGPPKDQPAIGQRPHTSGIPGTVGYNVLHSMVWEAEHGLPLKVHAGTERCLTWVGDAMRGLAMILESGQSGVWNVCRNDDHRPVADLARLVLDVTGSASDLVEEAPPYQVTPRKSLDSARLAALGWVPEVDLDEGVKRCWDYYRRFDADGTWRG
jgi:dTDP-glucose 4,6-dehydratase